MSELTALILRVTGEVQESNISDFEKSARLFLDNINKTLVTDQDFGTAKLDIAACQEKETQIATAKQKSISSMAEVAEILATVDRYSDEFRDTRLMLNKLVKTEEEKRKKQITDGGISDIKKAISRSRVGYGFSFDPSGIFAAIKGKKSLFKMEEAVAEIVNNTLIDILSLEATFDENIKEIELAETAFPGLFPDRKAIALNPSDNVSLMIVARVSEYKILLIEKERKEAETIAREAEAKRISPETEILVPIFSTPSIVLDPQILPNPFADNPHKQIERVFLEVLIEPESNNSLDKIMNDILNIRGVCSVKKNDYPEVGK